MGKNVVIKMFCASKQKDVKYKLHLVKWLHFLFPALNNENNDTCCVMIVTK